MKFQSLREIFDAFRGLKVLIIGDVMVDTYVYGNVKRMSPEAPIPVLSVTGKESRLGGAANVALNIQSLGGFPTICSVVGEDVAGENLKKLIQQHGLSDQGILYSRSRSTTVKNRMVSGSQQLLRVDEEMDEPLQAIDKKTLISHIQKLILDSEVVIFQDYDKGCIDREVITQTTELAHAHGIKVAVDPKSRNFMEYYEADLFKPNLKELSEALNRQLSGPDNNGGISEAVNSLRSHLHCQQVLTTLSDQGVYYLDQLEEGQYAAHVRSISDVSGAGDTVIAIASLCLALGLPIRFYAELANLGGGIVCEERGVVPIDRGKLFSEAEKNEFLRIFD